MWTLLSNANSTNERYLLAVYTKARLTVTYLRGIISQLILTLIFWSQVFNTFLAWLAIRCFGILPTLLHITIVAAFITKINSIYRSYDFSLFVCPSVCPSVRVRSNFDILR
jgi:hypothetical protein